MKKLSKNKKLNYVLNDILTYLVDMDAYGQYDEVKRYFDNYQNEIDYNLYTYGNLRVWYSEIIELYKGYKSLRNASVQYLENIYKRQVGRVARYYLKHREEITKQYEKENI